MPPEEPLPIAIVRSILFFGIFLLHIVAMVACCKANRQTVGYLYFGLLGSNFLYAILSFSAGNIRIDIGVLFLTFAILTIFFLSRCGIETAKDVRTSRA